METDGYSELLETTDGAGGGWGGGLGGGGDGSEPGWYLPYPVSFQVSLTSFLMLELVLGFSSNLTVLVLYCAQSNLVDSVSNMVTVNLHVLDIIVCVLCVPLTIVIILLPLERDIALVCCFHEACVTFTSIATAVNVLVISMDRYDISVRPANRVLTPRRAGALLAAVWGVSLAVFFIPFLEVELFGGAGAEDAEDGGWDGALAEDRLSGPERAEPEPGSDADSAPAPAPSPGSVAWRNRTLLCVGGQGYHTGLGMYYHLLIQVPIFFLAVVVMLVTYSRILQALNIRIGSHFKRSQRRRGSGCGGKKRRKKKKGAGGGGVVLGGGGGGSSSDTKRLSQPPLIPTPSPTPTSPLPPPLPASATTPPHPAPPPTPLSPQVPAVSGGGGALGAGLGEGGVAAAAAAAMGVQASVSAIIALRRAVRRHRDRRERQRRVFKMSLVIISTFLGCWAPISVVNVLILCLGPSDQLVKLRICFLAMAYGTTIFHPLLYAFTRQKLRKVLKTKVKKRVVSLLQVDPAPSGTVIHNSWVEPRKGRKVRLECSDATDRCLTEAVRE
ncbi:G-protein coupled receptor 22-like [Amia ocellicauda]|uniref:G-protein coupled receptor 22-like n=1 Tax=Amia ocellicauda TaxID=2972642 RepID=UPI0034639716